MNTYPAHLPCVSRIEGHSQAMDAGLTRTDMQGGNARQRRRFRSLPTSLALVFMLPQDIYAAWVQWTNLHAWDEFFLLKLPGVQASMDGANTAMIPVRFTSDLRAELLTAHRLWYWRVSVTAEYLPNSQTALGGGWIIGGTPDAPNAQWIVGGRPASPSPEFTNPGTLLVPAITI